MQYLQQTIRSIRNSANQNYQVIVASLVPGSGTTTLLLNDTHPKVCRPVFVPRIRVNTFPFDGLIYRASSDSMAGVTGDRTHEFSLRMCLGAIRRTTFITRKFRKEFMLA